MNSRIETKENPPEHAPRLPATRRVKKSNLPPFRLTPRDREVVKAVYTHRALTTPQIEALLFPPENGQDHSTKTSRVRYRLKMLFQHGYLFRDEQPTKLSEGRKPLVYFIDQQAVPLLAEEYAVFPEDIAWKPKGNNVRWIFLDHLLATNDVRIAIEVAAKQHGYALHRWLDDMTLKSVEMRDSVEIRSPTGAPLKVTIVPDGYFFLNADGYDYHYFLEVDMGTETAKSSKFGRRDFSRKMLGYQAYWKSGLYDKRYDPEGKYEGLPIQVLTVTTSEARVATLKRVAEEARAGEQFCFTTFGRISPETVLVAPIWSVAGKEGLHSLIW